MDQNDSSTTEAKRINFDDLALAAVYILHDHDLDVEPPPLHSGLVTFLVDRTSETERIAQDYVTSTLRVDPRRFYNALGIAKRLVHRAKELAG